MTRTFWLHIVSRLERIRPLPFAPFSSQSDLSTLEVAKACLNHRRITANLSSDSPIYVRHRMITLPLGESVACFALLPSARYSLVLLMDGRLQIWDLHMVCNKDTAGLSSEPHSAWVVMDRECGFPVLGFDFVTCGKTERSIMVAILETVAWQVHGAPSKWTER